MHSIELVGELRVLAPVAGKLFHPGLTSMTPALAHHRLEVFANPVRNEKLGVLRPAVVPFGQPDLFLAQRLAVRSMRILLVGRAVGDMAIHDDQGRPVGRAYEGGKCPFEHIQIIGVADTQDIPAVADKARRHVLAERQVGSAFDGDFIVVVHPAKIGQLQMSGQ